MTKAAILPHPVRLAAGTHPIENQNLDERALSILRTLNSVGFRAYLVGGCIRDLLLGKIPKDFDIATNATPSQIRSLFRNCRLIGRRFRLAHVYFGRDIIEVATFRAAPDKTAMTDRYGSVLEDNHYGTIEDDVRRRDFTINALYYDAGTGEIIDYIGALADIEARVLRIIGDPHARYTEDPVRMLRAARFSAKLGLPLEAETAAAIGDCRDNLRAVPPARLFDEAQKLFVGGQGEASFEQLQHHNLFAALFPDAARALTHPNAAYARYAAQLIRLSLQSTDQRVAIGKPVTIAFVFAAMLWPVYQLQYRGLLEERDNWFTALEEAADMVLIAASERVAIPMRLRSMIREIWQLQARLEWVAQGNSQRKMNNVLAHPRFRAAYDFLLLRQAAGEKLEPLVELWTHLHQEDTASAREEDYEPFEPIPPVPRLREKTPRRRRKRRW